MNRYISVLRRRWRIVVAGALVGVLLSLAYLVIIGQSYTARTDVNINVITTDPFNAQRSASGLLDGTTEAQIATSHAVVSAVAGQLDLTTAELRSALEATVIPDATVIRISLTESSAESAREGADAVAEAYLTYRSQQANERLDGILGRINDRLVDLREELIDANSRVAASDVGSQAANQAVSDRDLVSIELDSLLAQKTATESIDTTGGRVLTSAVDNEIVVAPGTLLTIATGLLAGLLIGILIAFAVSASRRRLRTSDDVARSTGIRVLTELPAGVAAIPDEGAALNAIRVARERIFASFDPSGRSIAIIDHTTGPAPADAVLNLAGAVAETGRPTKLLLPAVPSEFAGHVAALSRAYPALEIVTVSDGPGAASDFLRTDESSASSGDANTVTLVALATDADLSSRLTAARLSDAFVMVVPIDTAEGDGFRHDVDELLAAGGALLGAITVPAARTLGEAPPEPEPPLAPRAATPRSRKTSATRPESTRPAGSRAKQGTRTAGTQRPGAKAATTETPTPDEVSDAGNDTN